MILSEHYRVVLKELSVPYIQYCEFDMKNNLKKNPSFREQSELLAYSMILNTGLFLVRNNTGQQLIQLQNGVIRANCVDCIDRTNSFQ
jgi:hypothetical protein